MRHITSEHYFLHPVSNTFHGRDIFAPVAAWLSKTWQTAAFGEEISDPMRFSLPKPKAAGSALKGIVLRIDTFGNLMTNFAAEELPQLTAGGPLRMTVNGKAITKLAQTYAQGEAGEAFAIVGSSGFLEISVHKGNAARALGVQRGAEVIVELK